MWRSTTKAAALLTSTDDPLFTISGGRVIMTHFVGEFTTVHSSSANSCRIKMNPTTGADINLSGTVQLNALGPIGMLLYLPGDFGDNLELGNVAQGMSTAGFILPIGDLEVECSGSPSEGKVKWFMNWIPLDQGASVASA